MSVIRQKIEKMFEALAAWLFTFKYPVLIVMILGLVLLCSQLVHITIDTSTEGFLHESDPILMDYEAFRDQFGREEVAMVVLNPEKIFDLAFLEKLKALHEDLEDNLPYLDEVTSLINARHTHGSQDELIVEDLLETWPDTPERLRAIRSAAINNQMYRNLLLSEDQQYTSIVIRTQTYSVSGSSETDELDDFLLDEAGMPDEEAVAPVKVYLTDQENSEFVNALEQIVERHRSPEIDITIAGTPIVTDFLKRSMLKDMKKFMRVALLTISFFLLVLFRRVSGVIMPIFIVMVSLLSTLSLMAISGIPIKMPTQILPSFLLSVSVGASVHILVIFFQHFDRNGDKKAAIQYALGHSGLPVLMTSLTTAGGLLSFSTAKVAPIADLGLFASFGVVLSLIFTLVFLPVFLSIFPLKPKRLKAGAPEAGRNEPGSFMDRVLNLCTHLSCTYPIRVLGIALLLAALAVAGIYRINLSHDPVRWLPDTPGGVRASSEYIDQVFKGTTSLEVIVDTGVENGLYEPDLLNRLEEASEYFETYRDDACYVGKAWSITSVIKESNQALHANDPNFYRIPQDKALVAQELLLFENSGSDDLEDVTDSKFSTARFTIKVPFIDAIAYAGFIEHVQDYFNTYMPEQKIQITGMVSILSRIMSNAVYSMLKSYFYALIVITVLMILLIGKLRIGVFSMIPNIYPILIMLGIMGWCRFPMDLFTMLVGSIAIGLAVDDTIHFMHNFRRYYEMNHDPKSAVHETLHSTGRAMLVTTCVLSLGFFTFMFASMNNLFNFGFLTGITLVTALLSDYFIAPSLMVLLNPKRSKEPSDTIPLKGGAS